MGLKIEWTLKAASGYSKILAHLDREWTLREVENFEEEVKTFLRHLSEYPEILKPSKHKNIRRGPINKHTILTYKIKPRKKKILLLSIRGSKQKP